MRKGGAAPLHSSVLSFKENCCAQIGDMTSAQATSRQVLVEDECGGDGSGSGQPTKRAACPLVAASFHVLAL